MNPLALLMLAGAGIFVFSQSAHASVPGDPGASSSSGGDTSSDDPFYKYDPLFKKWGGTYGVPWRWLKAICFNESSNGQDWRVKLGLFGADGLSKGIMQVTGKTYAWVNSTFNLGHSGEVDDLNDPDISVQVAARYLRWILDNYFDVSEREYVIRAYNGGPGFQHTKQGIEDTPEYYARFVDHLNMILARQPGNELERS